MILQVHGAGSGVMVHNHTAVVWWIELQYHAMGTGCREQRSFGD